MNINDLLKYGEKSGIEEARFKSRVLLKNLLKVNREYIVIHADEEVSDQIAEKFKEEIEELKNGKPLQYITGNQEFMGLNFYVDENVLIPQPDTEILVEEAKSIIENKNLKTVLDLCTGSGAIAVSLKKLLNVSVTASDISKEALEIAKKNAKNNDAEVEFVLSDMFENIKGKFDIIVSNPPYVENDVIKTLSKEVQNEPYIALAGGKDGLDFYKIIAKKAKEFLNPGGYIALEIGYNQRESVKKLLENEGFEKIRCIKDYAENARVIFAKIGGDADVFFSKYKRRAK